jgi:cell wall integrity and stress response component
MKTTTFLAAALASALPAYAATATSTGANIEEPSAAPTLGAQVVQGCFSSWGNLIFNSTPKFNSKSACAVELCYAGGFQVAATTGGNQCFCGNEYPPKDTLVDDSKCDVPCPGYGLQACGGIDFYTVYNTGIMLSVPFSTPNDTASGSATPSVIASSTVVSGGQTSVVYVTSSPTGASDGKGGAPMGGIIAGVVVGVVVLAAAFGGLWFYMRQKRNREIEEEHRRNAAVNAFMGGKPPGSSGGYSMETDTRLDPVMAQRRMSSGSIADNQDYSRRILRVRAASSTQVCPIHANNFVGYQRVMTLPIYDERLLPVLYTSIGILRRLVNCLMSSVNPPRDEPSAFHVGARKATYLGPQTGRGVYLPGFRCRFLRRPLLRQSFGTSFGMPLARLAS